MAQPTDPTVAAWSVQCTAPYLMEKQCTEMMVQGFSNVHATMNALQPEEDSAPLDGQKYTAKEVG